MLFCSVCLCFKRGLIQFSPLFLLNILLIKIKVLYLSIIKTNNMNNLKKGQKFQLSFTSRFGKKITDIITIVCINGNNVLMDNGKTYNKFELI